MEDFALDTLLSNSFGSVRNSLIGFEPTFSRLATYNTLDTQNGGYPPYNLERVDDSNYRITLAVAGFVLSDIDITLENSKLTISGSNNQNTVDNEHPKVYLYKGIAERGFKRTFVLADHVSVTKANLENGLLTVDLKYEMPEARKPKKITIEHKNK
jgi:molecular chaperone IbpA